MADTVKVSLLHSMAYKASRDDTPVRYKPGIVEMPYEHARVLGVTHRIVKDTPVAPLEESAPVERMPFEGAFDEKLTASLVEAGYKDLSSLAQASDDDLRTVKGIGPANYERIQAALGRRSQEGA